MTPAQRRGNLDDFSLSWACLGLHPLPMHSQTRLKSCSDLSVLSCYKCHPSLVWQGQAGGIPLLPSSSVLKNETGTTHIPRREKQGRDRLTEIRKQKEGGREAGTQRELRREKELEIQP